MSEEQDELIPQRSWFERLAAALVGEPQDRAQLVEFLRDAQQRNLLNADALAMIEGVLEVSKTRARDIMVPRSQMIVVEEDATLSDLLPIILDSGHSRFPVIGDNRDEIVGILLAKDLLPYHFKLTDKPLDLKTLIRTPVFVPESKRLDVLLREFRLNRNHMALVVDEYGGIAGLITIEDILEEIVGNIEDEYDIEEKPNILPAANNRFFVKALTSIEEFNEYFKSNFSDEEYDTIGGLVMNRFGYLPKRGEMVIIDSFKFRVLHSDNRRILLLNCTYV
ncbi:MAG: HlyC/CorC family transporter [Gammaproteobacteria bacterium]